MAIFTQRPHTTPKAVLGLARTYFQRLGLQVTQQNPEQLHLEDQHGYVHVVATPKGRRTHLTVDSCGWEFWARRFLNHTE